MSEAMGSSTSTIYVPLLDEGTTVARPTQGELLGDNLYRIMATPNYNPDDEHWKFLPGSVVRCAVETKGGKQIMVARELVMIDDKARRG